jgi:hypothetical protein
MRFSEKFRKKNKENFQNFEKILMMICWFEKTFLKLLSILFLTIQKSLSSIPIAVLRIMLKGEFKHPKKEKMKLTTRIF